MEISETASAATQESASQDDIVVVRSLEKIFCDFWGRPKAKAINEVNFEVRRGEVEPRGRVRKDRHRVDLQRDAASARSEEDSLIVLRRWSQSSICGLDSGTRWPPRSSSSEPPPGCPRITRSWRSAPSVMSFLRTSTDTTHFWTSPPGSRARFT